MLFITPNPGWLIERVPNFAFFGSYFFFKVQKSQKHVTIRKKSENGKKVFLTSFWVHTAPKSWLKYTRWCLTTTFEKCCSKGQSYQDFYTLGQIFACNRVRVLLPSIFIGLHFYFSLNRQFMHFILHRPKV